MKMSAVDKERKFDVNILVGQCLQSQALIFYREGPRLRVSTYMCNEKKKCDQQLNNEDIREYETM